MKLKAWHGILVLLVGVALYFFVSTREGLDNPGCPSGAPGISSVKQSGGYNIRLYTIGECSALGGKFTGNGQTTWGMPNNSVGECLGTTNAINVGFCNQSAPPSAAAQAAVNPATPASSPMPSSPAGTPDGATMTSNPAGTPDGSPMTSNPAVPGPIPPSYTLTCNASPVSGMTGSIGMPETPAAWNINQPPPGHNSKHGYML
jgi:hypothetical protein